jgi:hypothetical protein
MGSHDKDTNDLESPLGIAHEPVTQNPEDHLPDPGDATSRRRRARALGEDGIEKKHSGTDQNVDPDGAAGIDMGYGGEGTGIKP